jgi:hypothetical protein
MNCMLHMYRTCVIFEGIQVEVVEAEGEEVL